MDKISILGKEYPCRLTMGALKRFKDRTGKELSDIASGEIMLMGLLAYCCTESACSVEGVTFDVDEMRFLDALDMDSMAVFARMLADSAIEKKSPEQEAPPA